MVEKAVQFDEISNLYAGVDIGSTTSKSVLINGAGDIIEFAIVDTKHDRNASGEEVLALVLSKAGKAYDDLNLIFSTGYGRRSFKRANQAVPEVICHGRGTWHVLPEVRTIIDIGGQDVKVIELDSDGNVTKFEMNDKCAAGTGRFFEVLSKRLLNVDLDDLGKLALESRNPARISSVCTIFAESEVISYLSEGVSQGDIAMGILISVARRIVAMSRQSRMPLDEPIVLSGGLAKNVAVKKAFEEVLDKEVLLLKNPQIFAALGAALMARNSLCEKRA